MLSASPPQPAIHVAASFIDVLSRCYPPTCLIALELMKRSHEFKHLLKTIHQASSVSFSLMCINGRASMASSICEVYKTSWKTR